MNPADLAARLLETFIAELDDQVAALNKHLLKLEGQPDDMNERRAVFRVIHTLKGASRAAGVDAVEKICHRFESLLSQIRDQARPLDTATIGALFLGADELAEQADHLRAGQLKGAASTPVSKATPVNPTPAMPSAPSVVDLSTQDSRDGFAVSYDLTHPVAPVASDDEQAAVGSSGSVSANTSAGAPASTSQVTSDVRVRADQLFELLNAASRLLITGGRVTAIDDELDELRITLNSVVSRPSTLSEGEMLHELQDVVRKMHLDVTRLSMQAAEASRLLSLVTGEIGVGVRSLRLRPFSDVASILPRLVRDAALATGNEVELEVIGSDVEADRTVLDEMREAIIHLTRNAVAHGVESPAVRRSLKKSVVGKIVVTAKLVVDHIVVTVTDDGSGIDVDAIRDAIVRSGEQIPRDDSALVRRLFDGGLSTKRSVDSIAGRGVGLDAVRAAMARIRGSCDVSWAAGQGTIFTLEAPVALSTIRAVLVRIGSHIVAIPDAYIERLRRTPLDSIKMADGRSVVTFGDAPISFVSLAKLLGPPMVERIVERMVETVIVSANTRRLALAVDELVGEEEIVVRPVVSRGMRDLSHVSGAALLSSGKIALVVNVASLVAAGSRTTSLGGNIAKFTDVLPHRGRILVADDSITTRTLEQSVLETAGYDVMTAVDGADAWRILQEHGADLIVSDVEMPRMDGFVLCRTVRASARFRELPLILVTALETPEDRERGIEAGADAYLVKSSFDQETLLSTIRQLIK